MVSRVLFYGHLTPFLLGLGKVTRHGGWSMHWNKSLTFESWDGREGVDRGERETQGENRNHELNVQLRKQNFDCNIFSKMHILICVGSLCFSFGMA